MRVAFATFGCKLNQYETEALAAAFRRAGHEVGPLREGCDLAIVNTCTVTSKSEQKARRLVRELARAAGEPVVIVTGCYAQTEPDSVELLGPDIICISQERKPLLLELGSRLAAAPPHGPALLAAAREALREPPGGVPRPFSYSLPETTFRARAFVKVQDGCDYRCAYCRVPLARGPSVSRPAEEVLGEVRRLEQAGYREIVLTGVNIAAYSCGGTGLAELVGTVLSATRSLRFRLSSLEPDRLQGPLFDVLRDARVCPHFHLPVQSMSDEILASMRRRYRASAVLEAIRLIRSLREDPFVAADVIAGFPGETDAEHRETLSLLRGSGLARLHVFPFSPRPGTPAWSMKPRTPERVRDERTRELRSLSEELHRAYALRWMGKDVEVLVEDRGRGTSANYLKVRLEPPTGRRGELVRVRLGGEPPDLLGIPIP